KWVAEDLRAFGVSANVIKEVQWMVKNHLELSLASFRKNPQDPKTWEHLQSLGLTEARLLRLAVFTAVDIRATNPEAWNDWKAKLLANLVQKVRSGGTQTFFQVKKSLKKRGLQEDLWTRIDPQLFDVIPAAVLTKDLQMVLQKKLGWKVYRDRQNKIWIRYFQHQDQAGLLSQLVEKITGLGCSIQHALIHTVPNFGVYDWFQIQSNRDISRLQLWLGAKEVGPATRTKNKAEFMSIKMISQSPEEWILSFRGVDQKGLLLAATQKLKLAGADILSARVHTWGRQVEDLFHIAPMKITPEELLTRIRGA
ncbi:MAG: protein-PII uridylyltransferase, partial [Bdellovibrio sp. CG10_big_fil_rev_8_21_14_0_10_47_8]